METGKKFDPDHDTSKYKIGDNVSSNTQRILAFACSKCSNLYKKNNGITKDKGGSRPSYFLMLGKSFYLIKFSVFANIYSCYLIT